MIAICAFRFRDRCRDSLCEEAAFAPYRQSQDRNVAQKYLHLLLLPASCFPTLVQSIAYPVCFFLSLSGFLSQVTVEATIFSTRFSYKTDVHSLLYSTEITVESFIVGDREILQGREVQAGSIFEFLFGPEFGLEVMGALLGRGRNKIF